MRWAILALLFGTHVALGLAMHRLPPLATLHAFLSILGAIAASLYAKNPGLIVAAACYISGAEVLWRMSKSFVFHETAKYTVALLCLVGLARLRRRRIPGHAVLYLALLAPAAIYPFYYFGFDLFRKQVLFHLSGPIAITCALVFGANIRINRPQLWRACLAMALPLAGVAGITVASSYLRQVRFTDESNFATSGGFGPNQVSSALALGALALALAALLARFDWKARALAVVSSAVFAVQSAMTFSRGGLLSIGFSMAAALPFLLAGRRHKRALLAGALALALLLAAALPLANSYTGGKLAERFRDRNMTGREVLMRADLEIWAENPVFGVGIGISRFFHPRGTTAHTEFTRALAESGALGLLAYVSLAWLVARRLKAVLASPQDRPLRGFHVAMAVWPLFYMAVNANRTSEPAIAFLLSFLTVDSLAMRQEEGPRL